MIRAIPSAVVMDGLFAIGLVAATFPGGGSSGSILRWLNSLSFVVSDFDGANERRLLARYGESPTRAFTSQLSLRRALRNVVRQLITAALVAVVRSQRLALQSFR
jgi:hypothetical protein